MRTKQGLGRTGFSVLVAGLAALGLAILAGCAADYSSGGGGGGGPSTTLQWSFDTVGNKAIRSTVARETVLPYRIFFGSDDWYVYCLNPDGSPGWPALGGKRQLSNAVTSSPCLANGTVYVGCNDSKLYALKMADGSSLWGDEPTGLPHGFLADGQIFSSPAYSPLTGQIVFATHKLGTNTGTVYGLDAATGSPNWSHTFTTGGFESSPAIFDHFPYRVAIGCLDGMVYCLSLLDGSDAWGSGFPTGGPVQSSPSLYVYGGQVFICIGSTDHSVYSISGMTGGNWGQLWKYTTGGRIRWSTPVIGGTTSQVFIGGEDGKLIGLNPGTGGLDWSYAIGGTVQTAGAGAKYVYAGSTNGKIVAFDPLTKTLGWWSYTAGSAIVQPGPMMCAVNNRIYIGTNSGKMLALNVRGVAATPPGEASCAPTGPWPVFRSSPALKTDEQGWLLPKPGAAAQAPTYLVPGSEFSCIQEAIEGAPAGSRLLVAPGEYHENIDFRGKGVTVESLEGPERTVLNGPDVTLPTVTFAANEGPDAALRGFTVTGGRVGLCIRQASPTLDGNRILSGVQADSPLLAPRLKADEISLAGRQLLGGAGVSRADAEPLALWLLGSPAGVLSRFVEQAGIPTGRPAAMPPTAVPAMAAALPTAEAPRSGGWRLSLAVALGALILAVLCAEAVRRLAARKC